MKLGLDSTSLPELLFLKFLPSTYTVTAISWRLPLISQLFFTLAILKKASPFLKVGCMFLSRLSLCALIFGHTYSHNLLLCLKSRPERHSNKSMLEVLMIYHVMLDSNCSTLYLHKVVKNYWLKIIIPYHEVSTPAKQASGWAIFQMQINPEMLLHLYSSYLSFTFYYLL